MIKLDPPSHLTGEESSSARFNLDSSTERGLFFPPLSPIGEWVSLTLPLTLQYSSLFSPISIMSRADIAIKFPAHIPDPYANMPAQPKVCSILSRRSLLCAAANSHCPPLLPWLFSRRSPTLAPASTPFALELDYMIIARPGWRQGDGAAGPAGEEGGP